MKRISAGETCTQHGLVRERRPTPRCRSRSISAVLSFPSRTTTHTVDTYSVGKVRTVHSKKPLLLIVFHCPQASGAGRWVSFPHCNLTVAGRPSAGSAADSAPGIIRPPNAHQHSPTRPHWPRLQRTGCYAAATRPVCHPSPWRLDHYFAHVLVI